MGIGQFLFFLIINKFLIKLLSVSPPLAMQDCQINTRIANLAINSPLQHMHIPLRYVQPLKRIVWLTRCLALSLVLFAFSVGAARGQDPADVIKTTEDAAMVVPMGLVKRVGDRSVILHW